MIQRIVKLHFQKGQAETFLNDILPDHKQYTRSFKGCTHLELWRSIDNKDIIFSYSLWDSVTALDEYRHSQKFIDFWNKTKPLFESKAQADSVLLQEVVYK